jgi:hypothetical protein
VFRCPLVILTLGSSSGTGCAGACIRCLAGFNNTGPVEFPNHSRSEFFVDLNR